jgi:peptidyl-dipeptidase Dcp
MENWCYEPEALVYSQRIIKLEKWFNGICKKIKESASFQEGLATMRQLSFGLPWDGTVKIQQQLQM